MSIAVYPGSFDPVTLGHLDIIKRAAKQFDKVIVCVMVNSDKKGLFTPDERVNLLRRVVKGLDNVEIDSSHTLLADYAKSKGASCIVKGLRAMSDFEAEFQSRAGHGLFDRLPGLYLPQLQHRQGDGTV